MSDRPSPPPDEATPTGDGVPRPIAPARGAPDDDQDDDRGRSAPGSKRHQARIMALQILFEVDLTEHDPEGVLARTFEEEPSPPEIRRYVERLVRGALANRTEVDRHIGEAAPAFPVAQLASVDRNVLRLAIYELLRERDVPTKAAINEAIELAKRFGGDSSGRFVNGVLGAVAERIGRTGETREGRGQRAEGRKPSREGRGQ